MKITDSILGVMDLLETEFSSRKANDNCTVGRTYMLGKNKKVLGMSQCQVADMVGGEFFYGANCQTIVLSDVAVKWYAYGNSQTHRTSSNDSDIGMYSVAVQMGYGEHFAASQQIGRFMVQEKIITFDEWSTDNTIPDVRLFEHAKLLARIGVDMCIGDLHDENWGFRPSDVGGTCPVILDWGDDEFDGDPMVQLAFSDYIKYDHLLYEYINKLVNRRQWPHCRVSGEFF